ncbi:hypothetical protein Q3F62_13540, partial [Enterococcus faecium]|nr:hypothetical protein [Enterococcus faecium]
MEEILENILDFPNWIDVKIDPVTEQPLKYEVQKGYEEDQKITIHDTEFSYNYIKYAYDVLITSQE